MLSETQSLPILALTASFISERRYLQNVSPKTLEWYRCSFKAFEPYLIGVASEQALRASVRKAVMEMSEAGKLSPTSINDYARCLNAFLKWLKEEGHISEPIKIPKVKTQRKLPTLLSDNSITTFLSYKPVNRIERRVHTMALVVLDTGMRIDEVRHLRKQDMDIDNLLITVHKAKGGKQRVLPFSLVLRRILFRFLKTEPNALSDYVFSTRNGPPQTYRNAHRILAKHI